VSLGGRVLAAMDRVVISACVSAVRQFKSV